MEVKTWEVCGALADRIGVGFAEFTCSRIFEIGATVPKADGLAGAGGVP